MTMQKEDIERLQRVLDTEAQLNIQGTHWRKEVEDLVGQDLGKTCNALDVIRIVKKVFFND